MKTNATVTQNSYAALLSTSLTITEMPHKKTCPIGLTDFVHS